MAVFRVLMLTLAVIQAAIAGFTALVGLIADGGDLWSRLLLVLIHPLSAVGMILLVVVPRPASSVVIAIAGLLVVNVAADLTFALLIAGGTIRGDWWLPLMFSIIPAIGIVYALMLPRTARTVASIT